MKKKNNGYAVSGAWRDVYYTIYVQSTHSCAEALSYVAFCFFSVCRIHVTLDNFTIWCTATVSDAKKSNVNDFWPTRNVVNVFSLSSIINIYIYLEFIFLFTSHYSYSIHYKYYNCIPKVLSDSFFIKH